MVAVLQTRVSSSRIQTGFQTYHNRLIISSNMLMSPCHGLLRTPYLACGSDLTILATLIETLQTMKQIWSLKSWTHIWVLWSDCEGTVLSTLSSWTYLVCKRSAYITELGQLTCRKATEKTPRLIQRGSAQQAKIAEAISQFNIAQNTTVSAFRAEHPAARVVYVDVQETFNKVLNDPTAYKAPNSSCFNSDGVSCLWWVSSEVPKELDSHQADWNPYELRMTTTPARPFTNC